MSSAHIYPIYDQLLDQEAKEKLLNQKAKVFWFTGLSGSGKSTIAKHAEKQLHKMGYLVKVLDGDNVRDRLNKGLGFSVEDRTENIRRIAEVSLLFAETGVICINCFVSPTRDIRAMAKEIIGDSFEEIFIGTSLEECENRDTKGLYKKARAGEIKDFTGISSPFEAPESPDYTVVTEGKSVEESASLFVEYALTKIK